MFQLKTYQTQTIATLKTYLQQARYKGAQAAWDTVMAGSHSPYNHQYQPLANLPHVPFVCLRLPTGGGKTLLSAHTIQVAAKHYLEQEYPVVMWLVPTKTILQQTLETLKNPLHPNRKVLQDTFGSRLSIINITDFETIRAQELGNKVIVVLCTIQNLRVENTDGRKVYAHNENLEPHFAHAPNAKGLDYLDDGQLKYSFRNLLHIHRPLVLIDEAHNASSKLSFEVLERINAACVVEYTATPAASSNVVHHVSASELKAEEMIKLPIRLLEDKTWEEAITNAVVTRNGLADLAENDKDYIRPIVLFQAEKKGKDITKDVLLDYLLKTEKIDRNKIAVVTGSQRELDDTNLFDKDCPIDYVITVEALKEGWDCSFAYVFCSVANVKSNKDIEQLLGRVLRMPYAKNRTQPELNRAYAHVSQASWPHALHTMKEKLVSMGFDKIEANQFIDKTPDFGFGKSEPTTTYRPAPPISLTLQEAPDLGILSEEARKSFRLKEEADGYISLELSGHISDKTAKTVLKSVKDKKVKASLQATIEKQQADYFKSLSPAERGVPFHVPHLSIMRQGELQLIEKELFLNDSGWNILDYSTTLDTFQLSENGTKFEIDLIDGRLIERIVGTAEQLNLDLTYTGWTQNYLCYWLNKELQQRDIGFPTMAEFIRRIVAYLIDERDYTLSTLARARYALKAHLDGVIKNYRNKAYLAGYQQTLFSNTPIKTDFSNALAFGKEYIANSYYSGSFQFAKHYYDRIGDMKASGEEYDCAYAIDNHPTIKHWVRNVDRSPYSFWLQTSTDKFYPDFIAELTDGRIMAIEYKGAHLESSDDTKEKENLGNLWAEKSDGKALFLMAVKSDNGKNVFQQIDAKIG